MLIDLHTFPQTPHISLRYAAHNADCRRHMKRKFTIHPTEMPSADLFVSSFLSTEDSIQAENPIPNSHQNLSFSPLEKES